MVLEKTLENEFFKAIHSRYDIEKPNIRRLIRRKLETINLLKAENKRMKEEIRSMREGLKTYADEYLRLGNECITQAHDSRAALANYNKALQLYPTHTEVLVRKGVTLYNDGYYEEALECFHEAVRLSPILFKAVYNRGKCYLKMKQPLEAAADFDKATTLKPKHAKAHQLFGDALHILKKEDEAAIHWEIATRLREEKGQA